MPGLGLLHERELLQQPKSPSLSHSLSLSCFVLQVANGADLVISVPNASSNDNAFYRIDYSPPFGYPEPNTTIPASEIGQDIKLSRVLPGSEYNFWLYYTNSTHRELLTWTVNITTGKRGFN